MSCSEPPTSAAEQGSDSLPEYAEQLAAFHRAFDAELRALVTSLPIEPHMRVLDVGCGDGYYTCLLAQRVEPPGCVVGIDIDPAFLAVARRRSAELPVRCPVEFRQADLAALPGENDFLWCAQSLYSFPEPVAALKAMKQALRPGGRVAVLENDTLHQLLLPWPIELEIALRAAEYVGFSEETFKPAKYYVGRRLPAVFAEAGLEPCGFRTQSIDRQGPPDGRLHGFLQSYLERLAERVAPHLTARLKEELARLIDPQDSRYLLSQAHFTATWINVLALGRRPPA